jgi:hypothetical protein
VRDTAVDEQHVGLPLQRVCGRRCSGHQDFSSGAKRAATEDWTAVMPPSRAERAAIDHVVQRLSAQLETASGACARKVRVGVMQPTSTVSRSGMVCHLSSDMPHCACASTGFPATFSHAALVGTENPLPPFVQFQGEKPGCTARIEEVGDRAQQQVPAVLAIIAQRAGRQDVWGQACHLSQYLVLAHFA